MVAAKVNVKEYVNDGEIDLSMLSLQDVPVKDIAAVKKAHSLDISNNHLVTLPKNFPTLVNLIKIDLSKNQLKELPQDFGNLVKLKHLDLYKNQLQHLPLSFSKLTTLKWLDLKDNPLVPSVADVAGPCLDAKECQKCAKDIVALFSKLQVKVDAERKNREDQRQKNLEENAARLKQEKKAKKSKTSKKQNDNVVEETKTVQADVIKTKAAKVNVRNPNIKCRSSTSLVTSVFKFLTFIAFLFGASLIAMRVMKIKYGFPVEEKIRGSVLEANIPQQLKEVLVITVEYILFAQDTIGNKTVELLGTQNVDIVWNAFTGLFQNVTQAGNDFYVKIFGK